MNQGEFYGANEYNAISEYKHFPAETYRKPWEENYSGKEGADLGKETTSLQTKPKKMRKNADANALADKLFNSLRGVATVATVAAASVAVTTSLITSTPQAELISYECGDTYIEYEMEVSGLEENGEYAIVLSAADEEIAELELNVDGTYSDRITGLKPEWEYTLALVEYDSVLGEIDRFEVKLQTLKYSDQEPIPPPVPDPEPEPEPEPAPIPNVNITGAEITGLNKVDVYFTYSDLPDVGSVELDILFGDSSTDKIILTDEDIAEGYVRINMETSATLTVTPTVIAIKDGAEIRTECQGYTHTFEETFDVDVMVGLYAKTVTFYPTGIACGANCINVTSSLDPETAEVLWLEEAAQIWYSVSAVTTYTLYLSNDNGDILSNEVSVTVDTSVATPEAEYLMNYKNPGDVHITYNDDGTINVYIQTDFTSESEDVYYQITLGGIRYTSRESVARIENIPDESYTLSYDVCMDVDGQQYSIFNVIPSGMVNEEYMYIDSEFADNVLKLQFYKESMYIDLNTVKLVSSAGEEILLTESDFTYNDVYGTYDVVVELSEYAEEVTVYMMANPYYDESAGIENCIGNTRKMFETTVNLP